MYCVEQPSDQRLDQKVDERMTENHLPGQYLDIALEAGQYKIYCPAKAFDPPTQSGIYIYIYYIYMCVCIYICMYMYIECCDCVVLIFSSKVF